MEEIDKEIYWVIYPIPSSWIPGKIKTRLFMGRLGKQNYIAGLILGLLFSLLMITISLLLLSYNYETLAIILSAAYFIVTIIFITSLRVRRAHDIGQTGVWAVWSFKSTYSFWNFKDGVDGPNQYGTPPQQKIDFSHIFGFKY